MLPVIISFASGLYIGHNYNLEPIITQTKDWIMKNKK